MKCCAILLDTRPAYLQAASATESLLLAPLGPSSVLRYLSERLSALGHPRLTVVTDFAFDGEYERRVADCGVRVEAIVGADGLAFHLRDYEPSDWLVIMDPRCVPAKALTAGALAVDDRGPLRARHLVALEAHPGGTTERVQLGANGTVGRIQRYYDSATWPFTSGVACSLLPVSCTTGPEELPLGSLRVLRRSLAERGVPSQDVFLRGGAFDLTREPHLLGLSEQLTLAHFSGARSKGAGWTTVGAQCEVDPSARLVGPVVLHDRAVIGPDAIVVGPAVIGSDAQVERDAMVAQCVVGPGAVIASGATVRHRAVFGASAGMGRPAQPETRFEPAPPPAVEAADVQDRRQGSSSSYAVLKALFDTVAAALGLVLISPLLLAIAVLLKLESRGPVLYGGRREGKDGRDFDCLKFRTMAVGAEARQRELLAENQVDGPQFKMARDPRVTRIGRVLRALNLDELPQLLNVLRQEMSLVGPRPSPFRENQLCIPWRDARLSVRPGITGLWQVCRHHRAQGDFHQWIHFDLLYVRHMGFFVDLKILAATLLTLGGHWPVPLSWIVSPRHVEGDPAGGARVKVRTVGGVHVPANGFIAKGATGSREGFI